MFDESSLIEDPFYNFNEMGESSEAIQSLLDPLNPNGIPFTDDYFESPSPDEGNVDFDPELFDSILSTGGELLARLESSSSCSSVGVASFELPLDEGGMAGDRAQGSPESPSTGWFACLLSLSDLIN